MSIARSPCGHKEGRDVLMPGRAPRYCAWVLRCREVPGDAPAGALPWRFSLEALVAFLQVELASRAEPLDDGGSPARVRSVRRVNGD